MVGAVPPVSTTTYKMTIFGISSSVSILILFMSLPNRSSAFHTTHTTYAGIGSSILQPQSHSHLHRQQHHHHQQQRERECLLFSTTALTSPLQPVPEESSVTINDSGDEHLNGSDNDNNLLSTRTTTQSGIRGDTKLQLTKQQQKLEYIKSEGGRFSFNTKYGALNLFAIYYGLTSILLGLPWFAALTCYQLLQVITFGRFDRLRRIPVQLNQLWGVSLLVFTRCFPEMIHRDRLQKFYKEYVVSLGKGSLVLMCVYFIIPGQPN